MLAARLMHLHDQDLVVLGLPRGGVPVAYQVAKELHVPLDVIVVRKLGVPSQPELAMGAVGEGGVVVINEDVARMIRIDRDDFARVEVRERKEVERRAKLFRGDRLGVSLKGRIALVIDDGIATGSTAQAACKVARASGATKVILAVPVGSADSLRALQAYADEVVCLHIPGRLYSVGEWYEDFSATSDDEVVELLRDAALNIATASSNTRTDAVGQSPTRDGEIKVQTGAVVLAGNLIIPEEVNGIVIFAHGSGSSRHSPRNQAVARALNSAGLATLLFDLLTPAEESDRSNIFNIELLAGRLVEATSWLHNQSGLTHLPICYFGASTGAAAALWAAAGSDVDISAVVSRGGRTDLAGCKLSKVRAATLLIVGELDDVVIELNRAAQAELRCENKLVIIPRATHLFEEPGALNRVAELASEWFLTHLNQDK